MTQQSTIVLESTEAFNPQRRGIGMQLRAWLEAAPFGQHENTKFIIASQEMPNADEIKIDAGNVEFYHYFGAERAYIDKLYELMPDVIFFPIALEKYIRDSSVRRVGIDYGLEDFYCRKYIAPRSYEDHIRDHEYALANFDGIVTVSQTSRRDLGWFFPEDQHKIEVIYPGLLSGVSETGNQKLHSELAGSHYYLVVGYEHKKNIMRISTAFEAFKRQTNSNAKLVIVGKPGYGATQIDAHIDALDCARDIHRLGYISNTEKQLLLQHAHALVALSIYEGFGLSALEGLAAGKIVLVSSNGSLQEAAGEAGFTADPFSSTDIATKFIQLDALQHNPKLKYVAERLAYFDQTVQAGRLLRYLEELTKP